MKIIVNENIPLMTVETLRKLGHDVLDIRGTLDEGSPDEELWSKSQIEGIRGVLYNASRLSMRRDE